MSEKIYRVHMPALEAVGNVYSAQPARFEEVDRETARSRYHVQGFAYDVIALGGTDDPGDDKITSYRPVGGQKPCPRVESGWLWCSGVTLAANRITSLRLGSSNGTQIRTAGTSTSTSESYWSADSFADVSAVLAEYRRGRSC